jgi:glycogen phosphorylase
MKPIRTFTVVPTLPERLQALRPLAYNLHWAWHRDATDLFRRGDDDLWRQSGHNPVRILGLVEQAQIEAAAHDEGFLAHLDRVAQDLFVYLRAENSWFGRTQGQSQEPLAAYFSAEFGLTECLSIFAGGLGILAGDHLKSASDLGVPLVGIGLLYQQGYFQQYLDDSGWQHERYVENDFYTLPVTLERTVDGAPLTVAVPFPGRQVVAQVWRAQVGCVPLYLLDTNVASNPPDDRDITDQLYGGDTDMRIRQEIVLGIGGLLTLEALGLEPPVYHMNEGHAAFLGLERVRRLVQTRGLSFAEAREVASAGLVFTTHTPVPAGHDRFAPELMDRYFGEYAASLGLSRHEFLALGRQNPADEGAAFVMTVLALRLAARANGVSRLHGDVTRQMWQGLWPAVPTDDVPIGHVTNGVHFGSWVSFEMDEVYQRYLGPRWRDDPADVSIWQRAERIPPEELWRAHERGREQLVSYARRRVREQLERRGAHWAEVEAAGEVLDPGALTLGFSRRFATYKRATLLLRDPERLARIFSQAGRPVQVIFAGKAHPRDDAGKELIRQIVALSRQEPFRHRMIFLEDYDLAMARRLVQGADVWLNLPHRPEEASGTSGMKAVLNGALHLSTLDGWWDEAWAGAEQRPVPIGWAVGRGETYATLDEQDQVEADILYDLLEHDVLPTFYERAGDGLPRRWIARMKASIRMLCPHFNTHRMVQEYTTDYYLPAARRVAALSAADLRRARELAVWRARVEEQWPRVSVTLLDVEPLAELHVGGEVSASARVHLGALTPADVTVEFCLGRVDPRGELTNVETTSMQPVGRDGDGYHRYEVAIAACYKSGLHGFNIRVLPFHPDLATPFLPGLIAWAAAE